MIGVVGWVGMHAEHPSGLLAAMAGPRPVGVALSYSSHHGSGYGVAAIGPPDTAGVFTRHGLVLAMHGHVIARDPERRRVPLGRLLRVC
jgi:hypothetical protein